MDRRGESRRPTDQSSALDGGDSACREIGTVMPACVPQRRTAHSAPDSPRHSRRAPSLLRTKRPPAPRRCRPHFDPGLPRSPVHLPEPRSSVPCSRRPAVVYPNGALRQLPFETRFTPRSPPVTESTLELPRVLFQVEHRCALISSSLIPQGDRMWASPAIALVRTIVTVGAPGPQPARVSQPRAGRRTTKSPHRHRPVP